MNQAYFDAVIRRYQKMEELDPGWNRNSLKHLNWVFGFMAEMPILKCRPAASPAGTGRA